ncbi:MAG: YggS family pyridoxal phosphate-dependent enzyme [Treponema sp.]|uniref:YggS family pyridoxal phosphate-dependent enzyme n=1 Tax=Treponema sp. TaxID=166 RepID=UPI0025DD560D|nr:YggS family pyridoxal phosphate-dependent enzyme [Treponema sp.]MBQ8679891.1 YggS family pyridoxal phosphate-dependent enzyme [Treponema sp.]
MSQIAENLKSVLNKIRTVEKRAFRDENSVKLVAVSKFHPAQSVIEAIHAGQLLFGENRVQEAAAKFDEIRAQGLEPNLHIIGSLQRNKVKEAVRIANCIESVDRIELIEEIEKQAAKINKNIEILFEVHTGEESKAGFTNEEELENVIELCSNNAFPHITPRGFMTMAPFTEDTSLIRKSFSTLRNLRDKFQKIYSSLDLSELSMGMSGDFEIAIEEGATIVRIGTAIFGQRN